MSEPSPIGTLYGVSLGPGDPGLITRRSWALLEQGTALWTYPIRSTKKPESYALDIVTRAGLALPEDSLALLFPMTHDEEKLTRHWLKAAEAVLPILLAGRDVLFLVEGDASTYATFGHLARTVSALDERVPVEVIPGVNAFTAACATIGIPLSEQDDTVAVVPAAYGVAAVDGLLEDFDTLVLLKVKPLIDELISWLEQRDLLDQATFIERCGAPDERVVRDVRVLRGEKVNYLSLMIIKNPHRVRGERVRGCLRKSGPTVASLLPLESSL